MSGATAAPSAGATDTAFVVELTMEEMVCEYSDIYEALSKNDIIETRLPTARKGMSAGVEAPTRLLGWMPVEAAIASRLDTHVVSTPEASARPLASIAPKILLALSPADADDSSTDKLCKRRLAGNTSHKVNVYAPKVAAMDFKDSVVSLSTFWMQDASGRIALEFPGGGAAAPAAVPANTRAESGIKQ